MNEPSMSSPQSRPPLSFDKAVILAALDGLKRRDPHRRLFAAAFHNYALNPPLPATEVEAFERKYGITLPEDYKYFLTEVGNGGAGPFYGVIPLGEWDFKEDVRPGQPLVHVQAWDLPDSIREQEPDLEPKMSPEEEDRLMEKWDKLRDAAYSNVMDGALPICDRGCGFFQRLVVNGPQKGLIWNDGRADDAGIEPLCDPSGRQMTFADWYLDWLDAAKTQPLPRRSPFELGRTSGRFFPDWVYGLAFGAGIFAGLFLAIALRIKSAQLAGALSCGSGIALLLLVVWLDHWIVQRKQHASANG